MKIAFTNEKFNEINETLHYKKRDNRFNDTTIGIGVGLTMCYDDEVIVTQNGHTVCELYELGRMIEELTMLKDAIEEETGLVL